MVVGVLLALGGHETSVIAVGSRASKTWPDRGEGCGV